MKAAIFHGPGKPLSIEEIQVDEPREHEVLVRTVATGVCHSDLHFVEGLWPHPAPAVLGHEAAGIVERVGSAVTYLKAGDHVISCPSVFCGRCKQCNSGHPYRCTNRPAVRRAKGDKPRLSRDGAMIRQFSDLSTSDAASPPGSAPRSTRPRSSRARRWRSLARAGSGFPRSRARASPARR